VKVAGDFADIGGKLPACLGSGLVGHERDVDPWSGPASLGPSGLRAVLCLRHLDSSWVLSVDRGESVDLRTHHS
jgi:hypothetical protein